jgi:hypothetical protein
MREIEVKARVTSKDALLKRAEVMGVAPDDRVHKGYDTLMHEFLKTENK